MGVRGEATGVGLLSDRIGEMASLLERTWRSTGRGQRGANEEAWPAHSGSPRLLGTSRLSMLPWQRGDALSALPIPHPGPQGRWQNGLAWALLPQCPALKRVGRGEVF